MISVFAQDATTINSTVITENYYFVLVALMWFLHVGFMTYETGVARRKNLMSTAMKNILTIAVVTPAFYYVGWWVYFCTTGGLRLTTDGLCAFSVADGYAVPFSLFMGPNLSDNITGVFWAAFVLFSWTTGSIMSGSVLERIRISAYLILTVFLGAIVWVVAAAWGWSADGWLVRNFGYHDFAASGVVHGMAGLFALGVLFQLGPRIGKYQKDGSARGFRPHNLHMTLMGLMIIFTAFYAFYAACLAVFAGQAGVWSNIYLDATTLSAITWTITMGFAGGFTTGFIASKGDPFWTLSGGLAGVIAVSAGADLYHPSLSFLLAALGGAVSVMVGNWIEVKQRVDDAVGAVAVHGVLGFFGVLLVGLFAAGYPTGPNAVETSLWGQFVGTAALVPLAFLPGYVIAGALKSRNLLRVPPEVELEGLDYAEFETDFLPEHAIQKEVLVNADGSTEPAAPALLEAFQDTKS